MAREIAEEVVISKEKVLKRPMSFYDGNNGEVVTSYAKGTKISEMKDVHQKLLTEKDI